jgi:hypothetical protein
MTTGIKKWSEPASGLASRIMDDGFREVTGPSAGAVSAGEATTQNLRLSHPSD